MKAYKYNKYSIKLEEYLNSVDKAEIDLELCAKLREKANALRIRKSERLFHYINYAKKADVRKIDKLYKEGADLDFKFQNDVTLYMLAGIKGDLNTLEYLKQHDVNIFAKTVLGQDALMLTSFVINNIQLYRDAFNLTPSKCLETIRLLRSHGLGDKLEYDFMGLSQNDYDLNNVEPYSVSIKEQILKPIVLDEEILIF